MLSRTLSHTSRTQHSCRVAERCNSPHAALNLDPDACSPALQQLLVVGCCRLSGLEHLAMHQGQDSTRSNNPTQPPSCTQPHKQPTQASKQHSTLLPSWC